jgi:hypothetical protein
MTTIFISVLLMALIMAAMAVGVIFGREPIKGSCGGLNNVGVEENCELCGGNPAKCDSASGK